MFLISPDVKVGVEKRDDSGKVTLALEPLRHPITVADLLGTPRA